MRSFGALEVPNGDANGLSLLYFPTGTDLSVSQKHRAIANRV